MTKETHVLACISVSPSNERIIQSAAAMANAYGCLFSALYVETSKHLSNDDRQQLHKNIITATAAGAKVETVMGNDIAYQIAEFARLNHVTTLVLGRSPSRGLFQRSSLTDQVIELAPFLDIHIIPDAFNIPYTENKLTDHKDIFDWKELFISTGILGICTALGFLFWITSFPDANMIMIYILGVLIISVVTTRQIYALTSSIVSVLIYNYFFTLPRFTLMVNNPSVLMTFAVMFISAFITSSLAVRLKENAQISAQAAYRTKILFDTSQLLEKAKAKDDILSLTATQIQKLLKRTVLLFPASANQLQEPVYFPQETADSSPISEQELEAASWTFVHNKQSGFGTSHFSQLETLYLSIRLIDSTFGVLGIVIKDVPLDTFEQSILLSILGECALALENEQNRRIREEEALHAQNEQLRANLLRSISHDLRTPLTSISGNASLLLEEQLEPSARKQITNDIIDDARWLITLVENLLYVTRIQDGRMNLNPSSELLSEIIDEALKHVARQKSQHQIIVAHEDEFLLVYTDTKLIVQLFINLLDNAVKHTQAGSTIIVSTKKDHGQALVTISDNGPGIKDKEHVFELFHTAGNQVADARRSMGMGLSLCRSILKAHGEDITVYDNIPVGTVFEFRLPVKEVTLHE